ncbi:acyl-CoA dehydrogenase family protein [Hoyosella altamirensis]|uniref:Acyl-CoA dehydrogenase n=1 Tax=Hoyosella altamirensis TaxID=616997 RepID=A0A839RU13_9ACTN|nr:acyl-CoA dehydrogenase family protein [Hoyosella altamirensis]MBB3039301.1 hypothetical protein [Hoyosella altamirensis]
MDFHLDDIQRDILGLTEAVLQKAHGEGIAPAEAGDFDDALWASLAKSGLLSLAMPTDLGGDGLGIAEVGVVLSAVGKSGARVPALPTLAMGVLPLCAFGTREQKAEILPDVAAGNAVLTAELPGAFSVHATRGGQWFLNGRTAAVLYAQQARRVLVPAQVGERSGVFLVDPHATGVSLHRVPSSSGAPEYIMRFVNVTAEVLGADASTDAVEWLRVAGTLGAVAVGCGALTGALELTTHHIGTRTQFGKPLATFQAVAQQIADVYIAARTADLALKAATWRLASGLDADDDLTIAAYWLIAEGLPALRTCHHLHGGVGVDMSYPLHRHYSVLKDVARLLGGAEQQRERLGV